MSDYTSLLSAASQLPVAERMRLIDELTETIPKLPAEGLSAEWVEEIDRRSREIDAGTASFKTGKPSALAPTVEARTIVK